MRRIREPTGQSRTACKKIHDRLYYIYYGNDNVDFIKEKHK